MSRIVSLENWISSVMSLTKLFIIIHKRCKFLYYIYIANVLNFGQLTHFHIDYLHGARNVWRIPRKTWNIIEETRPIPWYGYCRRFLFDLLLNNMFYSCFVEIDRLQWWWNIAETQCIWRKCIMYMWNVRKIIDPKIIFFKVIRLVLLKNIFIFIIVIIVLWKKNVN